MNELEIILKILENNLKTNIEYSDEDMDRFSSIYEKILNVSAKKAPIAIINDDDISFLKEKNIVDKNNDNLKDYVLLLGQYSKVVNPEQKNALSELADKELQDILYSLAEISKTIDNTEVKELIAKVNNKFKDFKEKDLDLLHNYIMESDISLEEKRDLTLFVLINSVNFDNIFELSGDSAEHDPNDEYAEDYKEIELTKKGLTEEECVELFGKYGYDFKQLGKRKNSESDRPSDAQELIKEKGNYEQIEKILELLKNSNINLNDNCGHDILREKGNNLAHIFVKSNDRCVKDIIDFSEQYGFTEDGVPNFYKMVITTRKFILRKIKYKPQKAREIPHGHGGDGTLGGSHEDFMKNVELFSNICSRIHTDKVVFLKRYFEKYNGELLDEPHDKIVGIIDTLKKYGYDERDYFDRATSIFTSSHITDVLDLAIELDILDDYLKYNPSTFSIGTDDVTKKRLYILSRNKEYFLQQTTIPNFIGEKIAKKKIKMGGIPEIDSLIDRAEIPVGIKGIIGEMVLKTYEDRIRENPNDTKIDDDEDSPIRILDDKFKENDSLYVIEGNRISRLKVIRVYNALKDIEGLTENGKNGIIKYALTRNSFLEPAEINLIMSSYKEAKEEYSNKKRNEK